MNECQEKALREGCHERETSSDRCVSTEKTNTKRDLARAMTKSKSKTQTVTNGCVSQKVMSHFVGECSNVGDLVE